jgi:release factor glutamine methyltransferase
MKQQEIYDELLIEIQKSWTGLMDKPDETPYSTLFTLWCHASGNLQSSYSGDINTLPELGDEAVKKLKYLVDEHKKKVPLAYLVGRQKFMNIELLSSPEAMIPRKETEIVGKAAVAQIHQIVHERGWAKAIDLCTGCGTLALSMAHEESLCEVVGADLSVDAVHLAARNAEFLGLTNRVKFLQGDLFEPFETPEYLGQIDLITCNPPYIASTNVEKMPYEIQGFEPRLAFDGGPFGIKILNKLVREAPRFGKPGSWICFEVGLGQGKAIANLMSKVGRYSSTELFYDDAGEIRALKAVIIG